MPRREIAAYEGQSVPRPDPWTEKPGKVLAKKHPKYVHGKVGMAMLLHKIAYVEMDWYAYGWHEFIRLKHPSMMAHTVCGADFFLEAGKAGTCEIPKPESVHCGMCSGEGRIFGRNGSNKVTKRQAKDRLGCIVEGTQI